MEKTTNDSYEKESITLDIFTNSYFWLRENTDSESTIYEIFNFKKDSVQFYCNEGMNAFTYFPINQDKTKTDTNNIKLTSENMEDENGIAYYTFTIKIIDNDTIEVKSVFDTTENKSIYKRKSKNEISEIINSQYTNMSFEEEELKLFLNEITLEEYEILFNAKYNNKIYTVDEALQRALEIMETKDYFDSNSPEDEVYYVEDKLNHIDKECYAFGVKTYGDEHDYWILIQKDSLEAVVMNSDGSFLSISELY